MLRRTWHHSCYRFYVLRPRVQTQRHVRVNVADPDFPLVPSGNCQDSTSNYERIASHYVLPNSLFSKHSLMWHCHLSYWERHLINIIVIYFILNQNSFCLTKQLISRIESFREGNSSSASQKNSWFTELDSSLPSTQQPVICPHPQPHQSSTQTPFYFLNILL